MSKEEKLRALEKEMNEEIRKLHTKYFDKLQEIKNAE